MLHLRHTMIPLAFLLFTVPYALLIRPLTASSFHEPHTHTGKVDPFQPGDPKISLDKAALNTLSLGKPYQVRSLPTYQLHSSHLYHSVTQTIFPHSHSIQTQIQSGTSGRGLVIQDIQAPTSIVWKKILDFDHYSQMVPKTLESKNYNIVQLKPSKNDPSQIIFTRMKIGFSIIHLEFFIKHLYYPALHSLTWTLDYSKKSDLDDSVGFWYVIPHPHHKTWSRVYYSVQVSLYDWVPKFVVDFMSTKALTDATTWVKKFSELEYLNQEGKTNLEHGQERTSASRKRSWLSFLNRNNKIEDVTNGIPLVQPEAQNHIHITWTRIVLISIVSALATFNIHLWLSK
jgi:hypothetical protein